MKEYIKTICCGIIIGACLMQLANISVDGLIKRSFVMGGEVFLPVLIGMVGYMGWKLAESYFKSTRYKEIYHKGYTDGTNLNSHKIVIPVEEELHDRKTVG